jgi:hypothetical protein
VILAAYTDRHVRALAEQGTPAEKTAAHAELVKRGLVYSGAQLKSNRAPRPASEDKRATWGWGQI